MKLFYSGLSLLLFFQLITGFFIFNKKTDFSPKITYEYFAGSESAVLKFKNWKDRFISQKTIYTLTKTAILHISIIGLFVFITLHIAILNSMGKTFIYIISLISFFAGILNFISPFFIRNSIYPFAYIKIISFLVFFILMSFLLIFVIRIKNENT